MVRTLVPYNDGEYDERGQIMIKQRKQEDKQRKKRSVRMNRKSYSHPKLIEYGHIEKLTQGGGLSGQDAQGKRRATP